LFGSDPHPFLSPRSLSDDRIMPVETDSSSPAAQLPLEWTRIQRTNPPIDRDNSNGINSSRDITWDDVDDFIACCANAFCPTRQKQSSVSFSATCLSKERVTRKTLSGTVLFCLTDPDCDWFQGYYFVTEQIYFGLLCQVKTDIDECLQCSEGGYREISMQMTPMNLPNNIANPAAATEPMEIPRILWTGGDMMSLIAVATNPSATHVANDGATVVNSNVYKGNHSPEVAMRMQAKSLYSGVVAREYVRKYFSSLLNNIQKAFKGDIGNGNEVFDNHDVIEHIMPNVTVVCGTMEVCL
jgi:hypothetical protein